MRTINGAIIILSGGLNNNGRLPPFAKNRIEKAIKLKTKRDFIITATRTTVYKAPPRDKNGYPMDDATVYANELFKRGIKREHIRIENCSLETLGSAYFLRILHIEPLEIKKIIVITSSFHMPRTKCIFDWIFSLPKTETKTYSKKKTLISYVETKNIGINRNDLNKRITKENKGIEKINELKSRICDLSDFNRWLFSKHAAYSIGLPLYKISKSVEKTY